MINIIQGKVEFNVQHVYNRLFSIGIKSHNSETTKIKIVKSQKEPPNHLTSFKNIKNKSVDIKFSAHDALLE